MVDGLVCELSMILIDWKVSSFEDFIVEEKREEEEFWRKGDEGRVEGGG